MKVELDFPRVIYRGPEDPLGMGYGESKKCETAEDFKVEEKNGWRLERDPEHHKKAKADAKDEVKGEPGKSAPADLAPPAHNAVKK